MKKRLPPTAQRQEPFPTPSTMLRVQASKCLACSAAVHFLKPGQRPSWRSSFCPSCPYRGIQLLLGLPGSGHLPRGRCSPCDLGDVNHAFLTGCELNECAELLDADNLTLEDLTFLEVGGDDLHHLQSLIHHFLISTADRYLTVIGDIDLHTGTGNDLIDGLTTLTYYITDSVGIDLNGDDLGSVLANLCSGSRDSGFMQVSMMNSLASRHLAIAPSTIGLVRPWILNIHLDSGNTFGYRLP